MAPCNRCNGPKEPGRPGAKYCLACIPLAAEEERIRHLEYMRIKRAEGREKPRRKRTAAEKVRKNELARVARKTQPKKPRTTKALLARPTDMTPTAPRNPVPSSVQSAWAKAKPGSIIRVKYPTKAALNAGDWSAHYDTR